MSEYVHALGLMMMDRRIQSRLVIEANKQFQPDRRHPCVVSLLEGTIFDRITPEAIQILVTEYRRKVPHNFCYQAITLKIPIQPPISGLAVMPR